MSPDFSRPARLMPDQLLKEAAMVQASIAAPPRIETEVYGDFRSIITAINPTWEMGGFTLPDGTVWKYREPNATVIVEGDRLRVRANPLTRSHDKVQVLDNAKHM